MRLLAALLAVLSPAAAPLRQGSPRLQVRLEALGGQPSTRLATRAGAGLGAAYRFTDQLWAIGDVATRAAPGGGIVSAALGLQATLDATPVSPYLELALADFGNRKQVGYSLAARAGLGADWLFSRAIGVGVVVRSYTAFDPEGGNKQTPTGLEAVVRLVFTPGAK
ncbi:MAG TPA: hypothetical protein VFL36_19130 [Myxococcales bacterium]|nr:hypothetical protein [Myxococcales bacterium]